MCYVSNNIKLNNSLVNTLMFVLKHGGASSNSKTKAHDVACKSMIMRSGTAPPQGIIECGLCKTNVVIHLAVTAFPFS